MATIDKKIIKLNILAVFLFVVDRISKWLALNLLPQEGIFIVPKTTGFILERNQGVAYSIPLTGPILIVVILLIIGFLIFLLRRAYRKKELPIILGLTFIIVGAFSNFLDRIRYDYVVDMVVLTIWPAFNLADVMIMVGIAVILWKMMKKKEVRNEN